MKGHRRVSRLKKKRKAELKHRIHVAVRNDIRVDKKEIKNKRFKISLAVFFATILLFLGSLLYVNLPPTDYQRNINKSTEPNQSNITTSKAAILDGLYSTRPNMSFTQRMINVLEDAGLQVDVFQGESVTINLLRNIKGYELVVLRLHSSIHTDGFLYLFSGEPYEWSKYLTEQLYGAVRKAYTFDEDESPFFAIKAIFLGSNSQNGLNGSTIILMGCNGIGCQLTIQRLLENGAKAYIAWNGYVGLTHSDQATLKLVSALYTDKLDVKQAVEKVMAEIGPDKTYSSTLRYFLQRQTYKEGIEDNMSTNWFEAYRLKFMRHKRRLSTLAAESNRQIRFQKVSTST